MARFQKLIIRELKSEYPEVEYFDEDDLTLCMQDVYVQTKQTFVIIIDEWDCIFREYKTDREAQEKYLDFLRDLLKDKAYIHLAYMTGILPIKKYGTHSALNMFDEFSLFFRLCLKKSWASALTNLPQIWALIWPVTASLMMKSARKLHVRRSSADIIRAWKLWFAHPPFPDQI